MRTINFNEEDIKQCKLALAKQNLTSLQSAFLMQHIINIEQENKQLKMINKEYERLNKENGRGFTITNVQEYDIYELLSYKNYKNNWDKLKEYINQANEDLYWTNNYDDILYVMQELERSDNK